jgi:type I restriction enzyme S subunit
MNANQLLEHFHRIGDAPDAIPRLRRFILDLAVRGKLVPQDPNDEPASELLKRWKLPISSEGPFDLPVSWSWVRVGAVAEARLGKMLDKAKNKGTPRRYLRNINVRWFDFDLSNLLKMRFEDSELPEFALRSGDVLICEGGEPGRAAVWDERDSDIYFQKAIHRVRFSNAVDAKYFVKAIRASADDGRLADYFTGTGIKHFTGKGLDAYLFPLPPLAAQHRIVAKVDELMALCDRLEVARAQREGVRDRLVAASLARLSVPDPDTFQEDTRFALAALPALTTRPDQIKQLRQTILNLAVRGKLVPQDPNDEPASELLKRIAAETARLVKAGEIKKEKPLVPISDEAEPFDVPNTWEWVHLDVLSKLITKGSSPKWQGVNYVSSDEGILFITSENVGNYELRKLDDLKYVEARFRDIEPRSLLQYGDILMNLVGASIGRTAIYNLRTEANINQAVALIRLVEQSHGPSVEYLLHYFNSPAAVDFMLRSRVTTAQPNTSLTDAREFPIPLPPLAEQRRIVAKVDKLMALCDQLEASLSTGEDIRRRLLEALLAGALAPYEVQEQAA